MKTVGWIVRKVPPKPSEITQYTGPESTASHWREPNFLCVRQNLRIAMAPDYYIETVDTGERPYPWRWELRRRSKPMGIKIGDSGYQSQTAAEYAGKQALERFLQALAMEERQNR